MAPDSAEVSHPRQEGPQAESDSSGLTVRLIEPLMAYMMRRYVALEAQGLKARAELSS